MKGLRTLFDMVESSIRNLKTLKVEVNSYGSLLVPLLNAKLSKKLSLSIARNCEDDVWPLEGMMKVLKNEIHAKEYSLSLRTRSEYNCSGDQNFSEDDYTLSDLVNSCHKQSRKQCIFCNLKNHRSYKCLRVTEPAARKEILKQNKNCFICFEFGHVAKTCNWDYKCKKCNGKHNVTIYTFSNNQGERFNSNGEISENSGSNNLATNSGSILLQTASTKG